VAFDITMFAILGIDALVLALIGTPFPLFLLWVSRNEPELGDHAASGSVENRVHPDSGHFQGDMPLRHRHA
jgi:hypothetical protein